MRRNPLLPLAAVLGSLLTMHLGATTAVARVHSFRAATEHRGVLTFKIRGLDAPRVRFARISGPRRKALTVSVRKVRRAARRGVLRVKMPRSWLNSSSRTRRTHTRGSHHGRGRHRLRVVTDPPPTGDEKATTRPVGSPILSDAAAASRVHRSSFEPRPQNAEANRRVPTADELRYFFTYSPYWGSCAEQFKPHITGNFTGTTDEIIQWAAHKWGIDEDIVRAVAVKESYWNQHGMGDEDYPGVFMSYGLTQVRRNSPSGVAPHWNGTFPLSRDSTAFNLDYWGASVRQYYEGCSTWLHDVGGNGAVYVQGDIWGSVGAWYAGRWWNDGARWYVDDVRTHFENRTWAQSWF